MATTDRVQQQQQTETDEQQQQQQPIHGLDRPLRDGERLLAATRRPDGTMRKPIRIRAGYTPQDEVAIYQSKGALFKKSMPDVPPGYDLDELQQKPKSKSAKKNQKRKEKKQQTEAASSVLNGEVESANAAQLEGSHSRGDGQIESVVQQMDSMSISNDASVKTDDKENEKINLDKRIRALRKKIRTTESLLANQGPHNPEQAEKLSKLDSWQKELSDLEAQREML